MQTTEEKVEQFFQTPLGKSSLETANQLFKKYGADKYPSFATWWDTQMKQIQSNGLYNPGMTPLDIVNSNRRAAGLPVITTSDVSGSAGMGGFAPSGGAGAMGAANANALSGEDQKFTIAGINGYVFLGGAAVLLTGAIFIGLKYLAKKNK